MFSGIFAQSFTLLDTNGVVINPGSTVYLIGDPTDIVLTAKIHVKNNAAVAKDVKVKKVIHAGDTVAGSMNYFCWGVCYGPNTYVSPFPQNIQPGAVNDQFYGDYNPQLQPGKSNIMYVWFDQNNANDSVAVNIEFNASPTSIDENIASQVIVSAAYPNPAVNNVNLDYELPSSINKASVVISNILGAQVKEVALEELSGKVRIPVADLGNGIYFYSVIADEQLMITRKFVVKR